MDIITLLENFDTSALVILGMIMGPMWAYAFACLVRSCLDDG